MPDLNMNPKAIDTLTVDASQDNQDTEKHSKQLDGNDVLSAAGVDMSGDDPNLPCLTLRMWFIGIGFCIIGSGVNTLYTFRFPSVSLSQSAIQFLAYPVGKAWELVVPDWGVTVFGTRHSLNPCRFNHKENILIYILANLSYMTRLSADVLTEQRVFYGLEAGWGFELMITLATILFGFGFAGLARSLVVEPRELVWPGVLGNTALNAALHGGNSKQNVSSHAHTWRSTRYKFFLWTFAAGFIWYWFPDLIFPALGYFTWICWIAPKNAVVNQVFGMKSGMGLLPFTFDWSQISYIGSPLIVPTWVIFNILAAVVFWIWIITPALYYSNTWLSAYLPLQSNSIFDNTAKVYNVSRVINAKNGFTFDEAKFAAYSDIRLPVTYALNKFGLAFATFASLFTWLFLEKRHEIGSLVRQVREAKLWPKRDSDTHENTAEQDLSSHYSQAPLWWYGAATLLGLFFAMFSCEYYAVQLRWYGAILAFVISGVFFIPH
ncbi:Oligopeptide transporter OPT superfamily, partial [Metarhizium brunneum ARSEF 3297]